MAGGRACPGGGAWGVHARGVCVRGSMHAWGGVHARGGMHATHTPLA